MESKSRPATTSLIEELFDIKKPYSFFKVVKHLLEVQKDASHPGKEGPISKEAVLFRSNTSLGFPARDIESFELCEKSDKGLPPYLMTVNFLGLYGSSSPLPIYYSEEILFEGAEVSNTRKFLDLFHHRFISLFFRSWEKYRYYLNYETGAHDDYSKWMFALIGLMNPELRKLQHVNWERLLPFLGLLSMNTRSSWVLKQLISYYFDGCPVKIQQFVEDKVEIKPDQQNCLGLRSCVLGYNLSLGTMINDRSGKFKVRIGPLSFDKYQEFLPDGRSYLALRELVSFVVSDPLAFEVELVVKMDKMPKLELSSDSNLSLGCTTWLGKPKRSIVIINQSS